MRSVTSTAVSAASPDTASTAVTIAGQVCTVVAGLGRRLRTRPGRVVALLLACVATWVPFRSNPDSVFSALSVLWSAVGAVVVVLRMPPRGRQSMEARLRRYGVGIAAFLTTVAIASAGSTVFSLPPSWRAALAAGMASALALFPASGSPASRSPGARQVDSGRARAERRRRVLVAASPVLVAAVLAGPLGRLLPGATLPADGPDSVFPVTVDGKAGLIDVRGNVVVKPEYEEIQPAPRGIWVVESAHRWAFVDNQGHRIGWGPVTSGGRSIEEPKFVSASPFSEDLAAVSIESGSAGTLWGYVRPSGELAIQPRFWQAGRFAGGLAPVLVPNQGRGLWGFVDQSGSLRIKPQFDLALPFTDGLAVVGRRSQCPGCDVDKFQLIDLSGRIVTTQEYDRIDAFSEGLAAVTSGGRLGFIDTSGRPVIKLTLDGTASGGFSEDLASVQVGTKWGYVDRSGRLVIPASFDFAAPFQDGLARVWTAAGMGFLDRNGAFMVPPAFYGGGDFVDGLAAVHLRRSDGQGGVKSGPVEYIDRKGNVVIRPRFDDARDFVHGLAAVSLSGKWGYVDEEGNLAVKPIFQTADDFTDPIARVTVDDREAYIDRAGRYVWKPAGGSWHAGSRSASLTPPSP